MCELCIGVATLCCVLKTALRLCRIFWAALATRVPLPQRLTENKRRIGVALLCCGLKRSRVFCANYSSNMFNAMDEEAEEAEEAEDDGSEAEETSAPVESPAAATVSAAAVSEAVAQCLLLPSPFAAAGRPPTLYFERPVGQAPRPSLPTVPYRGGPPPNVKLELNANSVRNALKSAGFKVVKGVSTVRLLWARHTGSNLWTQLPRGAIVNHFPGSWVLGRKDGLAKSLHAQQRRARCVERQARCGRPARLERRLLGRGWPPLQAA